MPNTGIRRIEFKVWELPVKWHYLIAVVSALAMFGLHYALINFLGDRNNFAFFGFAVGIAAFCGGFLPGVVATVLSVGLVWFFFLPPAMSFKLSSYSSAVNIFIATLMYFFVSALCHLLRETAIRYKEAARERDLNRDRLSHFYNSVGDSFCLLDNNLDVTYANDSFLELARGQSADILNRPLTEVFHEFAAIDLDRHFVDLMANRETYTGDLCNSAGDTWYHLRAYPDEQGIAVYLQDVTLRKNIENRTAALLEEERSARSKSDRASKLKDEFIATLSHELRTPLTSILGWAELLSTRTKDPKAQEGLMAIERSTRTQAKLIEELLDMNRIASGKILLEFEFAPLDEIVIDAVNIVKNQVEAKGLTLNLEFSPEPVVVRTDPTRMQQIVFNLLENAVKFTPRDGSITVIVRTTKPASGPELAEFVVKDTGEGIDKEFLPHIFDRFRQANSSISRRHGGLGLGLAIVKQLIELHEGEVTVESDGLGKGTTFTVRLPLVPFEMPQNPPKLHSALEKAEERRLLDLVGLNILVVEDDDSSRQVIQMMLADANAVVETAACAKDAFEALPRMRPDVLICDIGMPDMDGYETIRTIRAWKDEELAAVPAVALTAFVASTDRSMAFEAGFNAHVNKPIDREVLKAAVLEVLQNRQTKVASRN